MYVGRWHIVQNTLRAIPTCLLQKEGYDEFSVSPMRTLRLRLRMTGNWEIRGKLAKRGLHKK